MNDFKLDSTNYLKNLLDHVADPIFVKNKDHQWIDGNKAFWELMGGTAEEFSGKTDHDVFPREEADNFWKQDNIVFQTGEPNICEEFLTDFKGVKHILSTKKVLFTNDKGEQVLVGIIRDITIQKQLEELQDNHHHERYRTIFESTSDGILIFNHEGICVDANSAACKIYGYTQDELKKLHGSSLAATEDGKKFFKFMEEIMAGRGYFVESTHQRKDKSPISVEINGSLFKYSGKDHFLAVIRNITERKQAQSDLSKLSETSEQQRRMYETVLSNTADFNYVFDLEGRFIFTNKALLDLLQKSLSETIGKNFFDLGYPRELAEKLQNQIQHVINTKETVKDETPYTSTFGDHSYEYIFRPVIGKDGTVEAVAGSTRDITDLKEADKRKDEFLAILAHELRNPLAPIRNSIEVMKLSSDAAVWEKARATIESQLEHMIHLVDDLMDIARITKGKIDLHKDNITLQSAINHAIEAAEPLITQYKHKFDINIPEEEIWLDADFSRISQIFSNLLTNAAKYTNPHGHIQVSIHTDKNIVTVIIKDNGIGISAQMLTKIFNIFSQADSSIERSQGGLGIGLSLVKNLVELHNGTIEVDSEIGKGSQFTVRLPIINAIINAPEKQISQNMDKQPEINISKKILIVDDNEASAKTMGWTVEILGHEYKLVHNGIDAIELTKSYKPDYVLLDIGLPGMNGYDVCKTLRQDPDLNNTVFIAQTGWGQKEHIERSKEAGFDHHLVKPIDLQQLQEVLKAESKIK